MRGVAELLRQPIAFGGGAEQPAAATTAGWVAPLTCPRQHRDFDGDLEIPTEYNESVRRVEIQSIAEGPAPLLAPGEEAATGAPVPPPVAAAGSSPPGSQSTLPPPAAAQPQPAASWIDDELKEWRKSTVATLRSFGATMLTTSSGGVAVYFAVLKYLGWERAKLGSTLASLTIAPPVLLFAAAAVFALALRPSLAVLDRAEYAEFRAQRVLWMHRVISLGLALYAAALLLALISFALVLQATP